MKASSSGDDDLDMQAHDAAGPQQLDGPVEADPARRLEQHEVADARRQVPLERPAAASSASAARDARVRAGGARGVGDPAAALADGDDRVGRGRGAAPRSRDAGAPRPVRARACRPGRRAGAGRRPAGVSARKSSAAADADRRGVVGVVHEPSRRTRPRPTPCDASAWLPAASAVGHLVERRRRSARRRRPRRARAARGGGPASRSRRDASPHGAWSVNSVPSSPRADDLVGADVGVRRRGRRCAPRPASRRAWPRRGGRRRSGRRARRPAARRAARPWPARSRSMLPARSRWVGMDGQHDPDLGPRDLGQPRDLADRVHAHLEHAPPRASGSSRSSVIGRPVSELRLPSLRSVAERPRESTSAVISLAIVLPVEPVMPTTRTACRDRHQAASSWSAMSGSATTHHGARRGPVAGRPGARRGPRRRRRAARRRRSDGRRRARRGGRRRCCRGSRGGSRRVAPAIGGDDVGSIEAAADGGQQVVEADRGRHADHAADCRRVYQPHGWATGSSGAVRRDGEVVEHLRHEVARRRSPAARACVRPHAPPAGG